MCSFPSIDGRIGATHVSFEGGHRWGLVINGGKLPVIVDPKGCPDGAVPGLDFFAVQCSYTAVIIASYQPIRTYIGPDMFEFKIAIKVAEQWNAASYKRRSM